jgi:hypothetical protein
MLPPGLPPTDSRRWRVLRPSHHRAPLAQATLQMDSRRPTRPAMRPPSRRCDLLARTRYGRVNFLFFCRFPIFVSFGDRVNCGDAFSHALSSGACLKLVSLFRRSCRESRISPLVSWSGTRLTRSFRHGGAAEQAGVTGSAARVLHCCRMAFDGGLGRAYSDHVEAQPSSGPELLVSVCFFPLGGS